jgi:hypothetical protein
MAGDYFKKFAQAATTCHHRLLQQNLPIADMGALSVDAAAQCAAGDVEQKSAAENRKAPVRTD